MTVTSLESMTALCYQCLYSGPAVRSTCPACGAAMIGQVRQRAATAPITQIAQVREGARPLPGLASPSSRASRVMAAPVAATPRAAAAEPGTSLVASATSAPMFSRLQLAALALGGSVVGCLLAVFTG